MSPFPLPSTLKFVREYINIDGSGQVKIKIGENKWEKEVFRICLFVNVHRAEIKWVCGS